MITPVQLLGSDISQNARTPTVPLCMESIDWVSIGKAGVLCTDLFFHSQWIHLLTVLLVGCWCFFWLAHGGKNTKHTRRLGDIVYSFQRCISQACGTKFPLVSRSLWSAHKKYSSFNSAYKFTVSHFSLTNLWVCYF